MRLTISNVAFQTGLQPSAIRYYEKLGILPPAERLSGRRRYDKTVLYRLAIVQRARQLGFTLSEIKTLFFGFKDGTRAEVRWSRLADRKLAELNALAGQIASMQALLDRMKTNCRCATLEVCGKGIFENVGSTIREAKNPVRRIRTTADRL